MSIVNHETDSIPTFVIRGLRPLRSPLSIWSGFTYQSEADLRDVMAMHWWFAGWDVRTEVKVPNCGRIDVLAQLGTSRVIIEMKRRILTATEARTAYQQAHAYAAYLSDGEPDTIHTLVAAAEVDHDALLNAERAYRTIWGSGFFDVANLAINPDVAPEMAAERSRSRAESLRVLADLARTFAVEATTRREDQYLGGAA